MSNHNVTPEVQVAQILSEMEELHPDFGATIENTLNEDDGSPQSVLDICFPSADSLEDLVNDAPTAVLLEQLGELIDGDLQAARDDEGQHLVAGFEFDFTSDEALDLFEAIGDDAEAFSSNDMQVMSQEAMQEQVTGHANDLVRSLNNMFASSQHRVDVYMGEYDSQEHLMDVVVAFPLSEQGGEIDLQDPIIKKAMKVMENVAGIKCEVDGDEDGPFISVTLGYDVNESLGESVVNEAKKEDSKVIASKMVKDLKSLLRDFSIDSDISSSLASPGVYNVVVSFPSISSTDELDKKDPLIMKAQTLMERVSQDRCLIEEDDDGVYMMVSVSNDPVKIASESLVNEAGMPPAVKQLAKNLDGIFGSDDSIEIDSYPNDDNGFSVSVSFIDIETMDDFDKNDPKVKKAMSAMEKASGDRALVDEDDDSVYILVSFADNLGESVDEARIPARIAIRGGKKVMIKARNKVKKPRSAAQKMAQRKAARASHKPGAAKKRARSMRARNRLIKDSVETPEFKRLRSVLGTLEAPQEIIEALESGDMDTVKGFLNGTVPDPDAASAEDSITESDHKCPDGVGRFKKYWTGINEDSGDHTFTFENEGMASAFVEEIGGEFDSDNPLIVYLSDEDGDEDDS